MSLEGSSGKSNDSNRFIPPLAMFPEGQKSNGSCLLQWDAKGLDAAAISRLKGRVALLGCTYTQDTSNKQASATAPNSWRGPAYTTPHTVNSPLRHMLLLLLEPSQHLRCIWVSPEDVLTSVQQQQTQQQQVLFQQPSPQQQQQQQQAYLGYLRNIMLRAVPGLVSVNRSGRDLKSFTDYWRRQQQQWKGGAKKM
ncbi:hypothetical protein, conserved [Eimeria tenella]|uniref:Uncharacterized protein n=1 Tax=Eimeria tenella TaxID=5802 RepID=U6KRG8_EIMTE|nr:hypothetical protein, conserved [Eimeria tenella]CDJ39508.1 hypothetical protein, conserved [Eimeria tenella]|eukprot:XP_013230263.1 hypothetical protein, conserved [Eimeria tenella]